MILGHRLPPPAPRATLRDVLLLDSVRPISLRLGAYTTAWGLILWAHPEWLTATASGQALTVVPLPLLLWPLLFVTLGMGHVAALLWPIGRPRRWFAAGAALLWLGVTVATVYGTATLPPIAFYFGVWAFDSFWVFLRLHAEAPQR